MCGCGASVRSGGRMRYTHAEIPTRSQPIEITKTIIIVKKSPFRQLPQALERKQSLLFEGIRHAAKIAELDSELINSFVSFLFH